MDATAASASRSAAPVLPCDSSTKARLILA